MAVCLGMHLCHVLRAGVPVRELNPQASPSRGSIHYPHFTDGACQNKRVERPTQDHTASRQPDPTAETNSHYRTAEICYLGILKL
jgi:hypothetical protein